MVNLEHIAKYGLWIGMLILLITCRKEQELFIPEAKLEVSPLEGNTTTIFKISSLTDDIPGHIKLFCRWDFEGDSIWDTDYTNSNIQDFRYFIPGTYHPKIQVLTSGGISSTTETEVVINQGFSPPKPNFHVTPETGNFRTYFTLDASTTSDDEDSLSSLLFKWDFNADNYWETTYKTNPIDSVRFKSEGIYSVKLSVKDPSGKEAEVIKEINVISRDTMLLPDFTWIYSNQEVLDTFLFDASISSFQGPGQRVLKYQWTFPFMMDNPDFSDSPLIEYAFRQSGKQKVTLKIKDQYGLTNSITKDVLVLSENNPPVAKLEMATLWGNINTLFHFMAWKCSDDRLSPSGLSKRWDFDGDGNWDTPWGAETEIKHQYIEPGIYNAVLEIMDDGQNTDRASCRIVVSPYKNQTDFIVDKRDYRYYGTVKIGNQWWMAENLKYIIPDKVRTGNGALMVYYKEDPSRFEDYGVYYSIGTSIVNSDDDDCYEICPPGWEIPSKEDWEELFGELGNQESSEELEFGGSQDFNATHTGYVDWRLKNPFATPPDTIWVFEKTYLEARFLSSSEHPALDRIDVYGVIMDRATHSLWPGYNTPRHFVPVRCIKRE